MKFRPLFFITFLALTLAGTLAANWPQWRGPSSNGASDSAKNLPVTWDESKNVVWKAQLPSWSAATPIIWEDTVFVTSAEKGFSVLAGYSGGRRGRRRPASEPEMTNDKIFLLALDRKDGTVRWQKQIDAGNKLFRKQNSASPSPITDGEHVWIMTGNGKFSAYTMQGEEMWRRDIQTDYGRFGLNHGYASTPLLHGGKLFVQVLHGMKTDDPSYVFAVNPATGKTLWKVERPTDAQHESPDDYSTPQIAVVDGTEQLVISGGDYVTGHSLATGEELWRMGGLNPTDNPAQRTIASSVVLGNKVFITSTRGRPFVAFEAGGHGNITGKSELWTNNLGSDVPTPTTDGELIYVLNDKGFLNALDAQSGEPVYQGQRIELGTYSSSPLLADGKLYCTSEEGTTTVVKAGAEFEVLGVNKLNSHTLASPVAVDEEIYIRTADHLYRIGKK